MHAGNSKLSHRNRPRAAALLAATLLVACLTACGGKGAVKPTASAGMANPEDPTYFIPANAFDAEGSRIGSASPQTLAPTSGLTANPFKPEVILYFSEASHRFYKSGGIDPAINRLLWERFLKKYEIPYRVVEDVGVLQQTLTGVLVLPGNVALGTQERQAIVDFRARGGSLFASWMLGTRDQGGEWRGFEWMESALGISVLGTTAPHDEDRYIYPYGDSAVIHSLPAGIRIWTERAPGWWPLRISGANEAAQIRTWSRTMDTPRPQVAAVFDETVGSTGASSRMVYFSWPERLWMAADPAKHEGLLYDSLTWLLRQPSAYVANWPHPYSSAYMTSVYMADVFNDNDLPFADRLAARKMPATYFILSFEIDKSVEALKKLQKRGHEMAYEGDEYTGFKDQPIDEQTARMVAMRQGVAEHGPNVREPAGFYPPMDDTDENTVIAAARQPFSYMPTWIHTTDACTPFLYSGPGAEGRAQPLVQIPRITRGLEEMLEFFDEDESVTINLAEYDAAHRMGCVNLVRFANQSLISEAAQDTILDAYANKRDAIWTGTGTQLAQWWLERSRVSARLSGTAQAPLLEVSVLGNEPLTNAVAVLINLPFVDAKTTLVPVGGAPALQVSSKDHLRAVTSLKELPPGNYQWQVQFAPH